MEIYRKIKYRNKELDSEYYVSINLKTSSISSIMGFPTGVVPKIENEKFGSSVWLVAPGHILAVQVLKNTGLQCLKL